MNELRSAGAKTIALDVMFNTPSMDDPEGDAALASAIGNHGGVVLPLRLVGIEEAQAGRVEHRVGVADLLRSERIRTLLAGEPDGTDARTIAAWVTETAERLGLQASLRPRGRPRKQAAPPGAPTPPP